MEQGVLVQFKDLGAAAAIGLSALGSCFGVAAAGLSAVGAWKKCFMQNKPAPFTLAVFIGAPLSQTIYGVVLMNAIIAVVDKGAYLWLIGTLGGAAIGMSAFVQGRIGAAAADATAETGKGFGNYLIALGVAETIALFVMAFLLLVVGKFAPAV